MAEIRVIVGAVPQLLGEIITLALAREVGVRVVAEADDEAALVDVCTRVRPDVVVLGSPDDDAQAIGHRLLQRCPLAKVIALTLNGRSAFLFELRPYKLPLGELSPSELGQVIRKMVRTVAGSTEP
jgi:AmiR/NasT family two-component response regulator